MSNYCKNYLLDAPKLTLENTTIAKNRLESKTVDFSILLDNVDLKNCDKKEISSGKFVLYQSKKFKSSKRKFLVTGETPEFFDFKEKYLKRFKENPKVLMEIRSWGVLKKMANEGHGIALLPDYILTPTERKNIISLFKLNSYKIIAAWPSSRQLSKKSKLFIDSI